MGVQMLVIVAMVVRLQFWRHLFSNIYVRAVLCEAASCSSLVLIKLFCLFAVIFLFVFFKISCLYKVVLRVMTSTLKVLLNVYI